MIPVRWEYHEQYHGLEEEDLKRMSAKELEDLEIDRMMKNAWRVVEEVRLRIDGEPAPKGYFLSAIVSEKPGEEVFYNKEYLSKYITTLQSQSDMKYLDMHILIELRPFSSHIRKRRALHGTSERGLFQKRRTV